MVQNIWRAKRPIPSCALSTGRLLRTGRSWPRLKHEKRSLSHRRRNSGCDDSPVPWRAGRSANRARWTVGRFRWPNGTVTRPFAIITRNANKMWRASRQDAGDLGSRIGRLVGKLRATRTCCGGSRVEGLASKQTGELTEEQWGGVVGGGGVDQPCQPALRRPSSRCS